MEKRPSVFCIAANVAYWHFAAFAASQYSWTLL